MVTMLDFLQHTPHIRNELTPRQRAHWSKTLRTDWRFRLIAVVTVSEWPLSQVEVVCRACTISCKPLKFIPVRTEKMYEHITGLTPDLPVPKTAELPQRSSPVP